MNAHDKDFSGKANELAVLRYGDGEFSVIRPGRYVVCAVSGKRIALEALRYWNPGRQEAYAGPSEAFARWKELKGPGADRHS